MRTSLRYTGLYTTTFTEVGELEPGAEFTVDDDRLEAFLRRSDVELVQPQEATQSSTPSPATSAAKTGSVAQATADVATPATPTEEG